MKLGDALPALPFKATHGVEGELTDYANQWLILYFYPKDATSGCTKEGQDFRDHYQDFVDLNAKVFGISRDSLKSHENFKQKQQFPFELISDPDETLCQYFDVIKMKSMYGKQVRGIVRSTFLFNPQGTLCHMWQPVKVPGHVADVLNTLKQLQQSHT